MCFKTSNERKINMAEISGKNLVLRAMTQKEMRALWRKYEPAEYSGESAYVYNEEAIDARFEKNERQSDRNTVLGIFTKTDEIIGEVALSQIVFSEKRCDISIFLANNGYRGKGFGTEALLLAKKLAREQLGLERMYADVKPANAVIKAVLKKCGFSHTKTFYAGTPKEVAVYFALLK